jgi:hypothetical protein
VGVEPQRASPPVEYEELEEYLRLEYLMIAAKVATQPSTLSRGP